MKRYLIAAMFVAAGLIPACEDDPFEPPTTGTITLNLIELPYPGPTAGAPATPEGTAGERADSLTDVPEEAEPLRRRGGREADAEPGEEIPEDEQDLKITLPERPTRGADSALSAPAPTLKTAAFDAARVRVIGPTNKEIMLTQVGGNWEGTVTDLAVGFYKVVVEGLVSGAVDWYGEATNVQVRAGQNTPANVTFASFRPVIADFSPATITLFRFTASVVPMQFGDRYWFEWDSDPNFTNPTNSGWTTQTSIEIAVGATGTYYVRAKAQNDEVAEGRLGDAKSIQISDDITPAGDDSSNPAYLGFGVAANRTIDEVNIYPGWEEDWFSLDACGGDTLILETWAERHGVYSELDTWVGVYDPNGETVGEDDDSMGLDSYLERQLPLDGTYTLVVGSADGFSVGHYQMDIEVRPGPRNTGGTCVWAPIPTSGPIVFESDRDGNREIYLRTSDGTLFNLTNDPASDRAPAFSPDGSKIAFSSDRAGTFDVYVMDSDGSNLQQLTSEVVVTTFPLYSTWSHDGSQIAFRTERDGNAEIYVMDADGLNPIRVTNDPGVDTRPAWSPEGSQIAFTSNRTGDWDIYVVNPDGSGLQNITNSPGTTETHAAWSPDWSQIAFSSDMWRTPGDRRLFLMDIDGSNVYQLGEFSGVQYLPTWSPDGQQISFASDVDGDFDVYVVEIDGWNATNITESSSNDRYARWQPAGGEPPPVVVSVLVTPEGATLTSAGATQALAAEALNAWGMPLAGKTFSWTSLNTDIADVDGGGVVTAAASGQVTIAAETDGVYGYALVTVAIPGATTATSWSGMASGSLEDLTDVWGNSGSDVFAVGDNGTLLHYDGSAWSSMTSGTSQMLLGVWTASATDAFAVGNGAAILRYDGSSWSQMTPSTGTNLHDVWGASSHDVFAVGWNGEITHFDGSVWSNMSSGTTAALWGVWGASRSDVFAVGQAGTILHYDGTDWNAMTSGTTSDLNSVWGTSGADVYAVGSNGTILHYDGSSWSSMTSGTTLPLFTVWGSSSGDVYAAGESGTIVWYNGFSWNPLTSGTTLTILGLWGAPNPGLFTAGAGGEILFGDRVGFPVATVEVTPEGASLVGIGATQTFTGVARDGVGDPIPDVPIVWSSLNPNVATVDPVTGQATAAAPGQVTIAAEAAGVYGYALLTVEAPGYQEVNLWTVETQGTPTTLDAVWGSSSTDVFAVGSGGVISHYDGTAWSTMASGTPEDLRAVWGSSGSDVFAVGLNGVILHYDGAGWNPMASPFSVNLGVWGAAPNDVYAVGNTRILHYDGTDWTIVHTHAGDLNDVWGCSPDTVYGVGSGGQILHYDGTAWSAITSPTTNTLWGIWGASCSNIYAVGDNGTVVRFDGTVWSAQTDMHPQPFRDVWGTASDDIYVVGDAGIHVWFEGAVWVTKSSGTTDDLLGVWGGGGPMVHYVGAAETVGYGFRDATVTVLPDTDTLTVIGDTVRFAADVRDAGANPITDAALLWDSFDETVATVDADGLVTAVAEGTTTIRARWPGGAQGSATIVVLPVEPGNIAAGYDHSCGIDASGNAYCWGYNNYGQLGTGTTNGSASPVAVTGGHTFDRVDAGERFSCGVASDSTAYCWGLGSNGRLGNGTMANSLSPSTVVGGHKFVTVAPGNNHACGVASDSTAYCWGYNGWGQVGNGSTTDVSAPAAVLGGLDYVDVAAGYAHSCGVTASGDAYCWGRNNYGELGDGTAGTADSSHTAVLVLGGQTFRQIDVGWYHSCGVTADRELYCWGNGSYIGTGGGSSSIPVQVSIPDPVEYVTAQQWASCAITSAGTAYCWGSGSYGQGGDGTTWFHSTPVQVSSGAFLRSISTGGYHTCAGTEAGEAYCWGRNSNGQLGDANLPHVVPLAVAGGLTLQSIESGGYHTCGLDASGNAYCWGEGGWGQLGNGVFGPSTTPVSVLGALALQQVSGGGRHTCAVTTGQAAYCWGYNFQGQLGTGNTVNTSAPVAVSGGHSFATVSSGYSHTCGVTTPAGSVYCWGSNSDGQLGDGTTNSDSTPVAVSLPETIQAVTTGTYHSCALGTSGTAYCWGHGLSGELGHGVWGSSLIPVTVSGGPFQSIEAGDYYTCGLDPVGNAYCWGSGWSGQIGDGTTTSYNIPTLVPGTTYQWISAGDATTGGITSGGAAQCWGRNDYGQVGNGTQTDRELSPLAVTGGAGYQQVTTDAWSFSCGLDASGAPYCWGDNADGYLGVGYRSIETTPVGVSGLTLKVPPMAAALMPRR